MASINELYSRGRKEGKAQIFFQIFVTETPKRQKPIAKLIRFKAETRRKPEKSNKSEIRAVPTTQEKFNKINNPAEIGSN